MNCYERLLLLSFCDICQGKSRARSRQKANAGNSKLSCKQRIVLCKTCAVNDGLRRVMESKAAPGPPRTTGSAPALTKKKAIETGRYAHRAGVKPMCHPGWSSDFAWRCCLAVEGSVPAFRYSGRIWRAECVPVQRDSVGLRGVLRLHRSFASERAGSAHGDSVNA